MNRPAKIEINVNEATSAKHLHQMLFDALKFPEYYGANWDAFQDVIENEEVLPAQLVLNGWSELETRLPREAKLMRKCLIDYQKEYSDSIFKVVYT